MHLACSVAVTLEITPDRDFMEKYQLIYSGERCGPFAKLPLEEHLKLLKLSEAACEKISSGSSVVLKSGLDEPTMLEQKALFSKRGLVAKHRLALTPQVFHAGLKPLKDVDSNQPHPVIVLHKENEPPQLFSRPLKTEISTAASNNKGTKNEPIFVSYLNYQIGLMVLMVLAAATSLLLLTPVMTAVQSVTSYNAIVTICGLSFLLSSMLMLPRLFQPLQITEISKGNNKIQLVDQVSLIIGKKSLNWHTADLFGNFNIASKDASAYSDGLLYSWNVNHRIEDTGSAAIDDIHSAITQGTIIEVVESIWKKIEQLIERRSSGGKASLIDWDCEPASAVFNAKNEVVALIFNNRKSAYKIVRSNLSDDIILHAFCLSIHKRGFA